MRYFSIAYLIIFSFLSRQVFSFPEMLRHGYPNCITCHVSPNGGGITTPYGKALSKEVLSLWNFSTEEEEEEEESSSFLAPTDWLLLGANIRSITSYREKPTKKSKYILMQADVETAVVTEKWRLVATAGRQEFPKENQFVSRRHYIAYQLSERNMLRAGRFQQAYGLNSPNHTIPVKESLGWSHALSGESYNIEFSHLSEKFNFYLTSILAHPKEFKQKEEKAISFKTSYVLNESYKLGLSGFYSKSDDENRVVTGPFAILAFTPHLFILSEIDFQERKLNEIKTKGFVHYSRLDYELIQGIHAYITREDHLLNLDDKNTQSNSLALGGQIFPFPSLELNFQWHQTKRKTSSEAIDLYWLMIHFYL